MAKDNFQRARKILLEAVYTVIEAASMPQISQERVQATSRPSTVTLSFAPSSSQLNFGLHGSGSSSSSQAVQEHRRVFD